MKREFLDEIARMVSIHVTANFLTKPCEPQEPKGPDHPVNPHEPEYRPAA